MSRGGSNTYRLTLIISPRDYKVLKSIFNSLYPDTLFVPENCIVDVKLEENVLQLTIECRHISLLRALFNSYFSILSMILHTYEGLIHESKPTA